MPRKAKDEINEFNNVEVKSNKNVAKSKTSKKASDKVAETKATTKKATEVKKTAFQNTSSKKSTTKKRTSKKVDTNKVKTTTFSKVKSTIVEYYDLPFRYNQTVVRILAQTPTTLFIYWDISDNDRKSYEENFGKDFFENTKPVLIITNKTMNYTFEVEINDFANSWYLHVNDADCDYKVELGRRFIVNSNPNAATSTAQENPHGFSRNDYVYVASSNELETPNNHILFDRLGKSVFFRNVKTNFVEEKTISSLSYIQNIGKIYNIYDLYKEIYKNELDTDEFGFNLPSSSSSSSFK